MNDYENPDLGLKKRVRGLQKAPKKEFCLKLYLSQQQLASFAEEATKAGFRSTAHKLFPKKEHGFSDEQELNTTGIASFIRDCMFPAWLKSEANRILRVQKIKEDAEEEGGIFLTRAEAEKRGVRIG